jgi:hypothetical protein
MPRKNQPKTGKIDIFTDSSVDLSELGEIFDGLIQTFPEIEEDEEGSAQINFSPEKSVSGSSDFIPDTDFKFRIPTHQQLASRAVDEEDIRFGDPITRSDYLRESFGLGDLVSLVLSL